MIEKAKLKRSPLSLWTFIVIIIGVIFILYAYTSHKELSEEAIDITEDLSNTYSVATGSVLSDLDMFLQNSAKSYLIDKKEYSEVKSILKHRMDSNPYMLDALILNDKGEIALWTREDVPPNVSDRSYYTFHKNQKESRAFVGEPNLSRVHEDRWFFAISRGIFQDGEFLGVGVAIIDIEVMQNIFSRFLNKKNSSVALIQSEGVFLFRYPNSLVVKTGVKIPEITAADIEVFSEEKRTFKLIEHYSGERLATAMPLKGYNIASVATVDLDAHFESWKERFWFFLFLYLTLSIISLRFVLKHKKVVDEANRQYEQYLESIEMLDEISKNMPGAIYQFHMDKDNNMSFLYATESLSKMLGVDFENMKANAVVAFTNVHKDDIDIVFKSIEDSKNTLKPWREEFRIVHPEIGEIWVEGHAIPKKTEDRSVLWHGYLTDISEKKILQKRLEIFNFELKERLDREIAEIERLEADKNTQEALLIQRSKLADMGEMISIITHQWKQPLNALTLLIQIIPEVLDGDIDKITTLELVQKVEKQIIYMNHTIDDFKNFLSPSRKKDYFFPKECIDEMECLLSPLLSKLKIELSVDIKDDFSFYGFKNEFKQIILNMVKNSGDALEENLKDGRAIKIEVYKEEDIGIISVEDNAGGIKESLLPDKIFDAYTTSKGEKGTGIGLNIVYKIVTEHFGGTIVAFNREHGAKFVVSLPIADNKSF